MTTLKSSKNKDKKTSENKKVNMDNYYKLLEIIQKSKKRIPLNLLIDCGIEFKENTINAGSVSKTKLACVEAKIKSL